MKHLGCVNCAAKLRVPRKVISDASHDDSCKVVMNE